MPRRDPLPALTAPRFAPAFLVFLAHCWMLLKGANPLTFSFPHEHIAAGVQFFFLLSGFILTYNYLDALRAPTPRAVWNFWLARWARLYPVHVLASLAALPATIRLFQSGIVSDPFAVTLTHVFLVQSFTPVNSLAINAYNGVAWTLSIECMFYLLLPLLIPALTRGSFARRTAVVLFVLAPWLAAVASVCGAFALPEWIHPLRFPLVRMVDFVVGVVLGLYWHHRRSQVPATASVRRATLIEVAALVGLAAWALACYRITNGKTWEPAVGWSGVYLPPFAVCVWVLADGRGRVSRVLATQPMQYLGEIAYSFYMFHIPVIGALLLYGWKFGFHKWNWPAQWAAATAITFALTAACYRFYEIPLRDLIRRRFSIRKPKVEAPAVVGPTVPASAPARAA
jgi:peptidoglycan/LPS O-acetylase OafA/YrhL